ncbi:unnamed protein product [Coregonus sp. 'balchen']|nr:unnamed protein product [Coregonus sp. 'balchen']
MIHYVNEVKRQLMNTPFYRRLPSDPTTIFKKDGGLEALTVFLNQHTPETLPSTPCIKEIA